MATPAWDFVIAFPAVSLKTAVEFGDTAVVPHSDARYQVLTADDDNVRRYLGSFRTAFGSHLRPSIVVRRRGRPALEKGGIPNLRNIIAVASVVNARVARCVHRFGGMGPVFSDLFEFHPVGLARSGRRLVVDTAARELGLDDIDHFLGQPHPAYVYPENVDPEPDPVLVEALRKLWQSGLQRGPRGAFRRRVFRSLELAYYALSTMAGNLGSPTDRVLPLALWVAACEVLAHPPARDVHVRDVLDMIRRTPWHDKRLVVANTRQIEYRRPPKPPKALSPLPLDIRPVRVYQRLYALRNQSFHGGTIDWRLVRGDARRHETDLRVAVAALYRGVLLSELALQGFHRFPRSGRTLGSQVNAAAAWISDYSPFENTLSESCVHRRVRP